MFLLILFVLCVGANGDPNQECGRISLHESLVIEGSAPERGVPWQAGIYRKNTSPYMLIGGGTLISNSVVITAAHFFWNSVDKMMPASQFAVAVGKSQRHWNSSYDNDAQKSDVKEIHIPSRFRGDQTNFQDDIAVVIVTTPFEYNTYTRPACISFDINFEREQLHSGAVGKVAGWGLTQESEEPSLFLKVIDVPYVDIQKCLEDSPASIRGYLTSDKFCAGVLNSNLICKGDSGGGLVFPTNKKNGQQYYLRGVLSTALSTSYKQCNDGYTLFTQISKHESFIKQFWTESL